MNYAVSVRTLCEFAARRGDLDLRFHLAPSAQEGMLGHRIVTSRRPAHYQKEVPLQARHGALTVRGRADGFDPQARRLEEIKTYRGRLRDLPASHGGLHWAQARLYGHLMCRQLKLEGIELALVYFNIATGRETVRREHCSAVDLERHFNGLCDAFLAWARREMAHRDKRNAALQALQLPFNAFRDGQRALAKAVYRGLRDGACLAAQAPTGIGKTMGTLFPALKAMPAHDMDKLFFLTAKNSGRNTALYALKALRGPRRMPLRVLELAAREHACEHPGKHCHAESCPLARGFYDRLGAARQQALQAGMLDRAALRRHALEHGLCPYHLGAELVPWCDVIVGDYNYYFDVGAVLHAQAVSQEWRTAVLVDEAHNLLERARAMYSAKLRLQDLRALLRAAPAPPRAASRRRPGAQAAESKRASPVQASLWPGAGPTDAPDTADTTDTPETLDTADTADTADTVDAPARPASAKGLRSALSRLARAWAALIAGQTGAYHRHAALPDAFVQSLRQAAGALSDHLEHAALSGRTEQRTVPGRAEQHTVSGRPESGVVSDGPQRSTVPGGLQRSAAPGGPERGAGPGHSGQHGNSAHDKVLRFYFDIQHFLRMADSFGTHSVFETTAARDAASRDTCSECAIRNVVPAPFLKPRFDSTHACVLFSATLRPQRFYTDVLGLPDSTAWLDIDTPFRAEQLQVRVVRDISTRYADRAASLEPMAATIAAQYARKPGNYLVFASSFDYLHQLADVFGGRHPGIALWTQSRDMDETARAQFLARFEASGRGVGFAVLGGVFAEGIDLPGDCLIGAFIATLGLPQVNPMNETLRQCLDTGFAGRGYDYAYLYPGLRKVVQAAGRIIRTPQDEGVVYLMDDRYNRPAVRRLLPSWWRFEQVEAMRAAHAPAAGRTPQALSAAPGQAG